MARHRLFYRQPIWLSFMLLLLSGSVALAQYDTAWVRFYNGPTNGADDGNAIAVDRAGNVYVAGPSVGSGTGQDYCVVKYAPNGNIRWTARYNGPANSTDVAAAVAVDSSGNVYVTGNAIGNAGNNDIVTVKYDSSGVQQWVAVYAGPGNSHDYANQIAIDHRGDIVVSGYAWNTNYDYVVIKYRNDGLPLWWAYYNGPANSTDLCYSLAIDAANCVVIAGTSSASSGGYDYATVKYDQDGNLLWARRYNGTGNSSDIVYSVTTDPAGNVYVSGLSYGAAGADGDIVTIKYDRDGNQLWVARYNGPGNDADEGRCVRVHTTGDVYVCGSSMGIGTNADMTTLCYDSSGNQLWVARYNGSSSSSDYAYSLGIDSAGNVYVAGTSVEPGAGNQATMLRYDRGGNQEWLAIFGRPGSNGDLLRQIVVDRYANAYACGYSFSNQGQDMLVIKYIQPDAAAGPILAPLGRLDTNAIIVPRARVRNRGTAPCSFRAYCRIATIGRTELYFDSVYVVGLDRGESLEVIWDTWPGPHQLYQYVVSCSVAVANDIRPWNDTASGYFSIVAGTPGWCEVRSVPSMPSGRTVKDGGTMTFHAGNGLIYLLKGNKSGDFYSFHPLANSYTQLPPLPNGPADKPVYKGAAIATDGSRYIYAVKGNNTEEFWRYDINSGTWEVRDSVPYGMSGKKVKGGGELLYCNGYCYLLKGYRNEFYRYDPVRNEWSELPAAPSPSLPQWDRGSFAVWDGGNFIYACKAKYNELWRYNIGAGAWETSPRAPMPFYGCMGKTKRLKAGGAGTWDDGAIYAFKGGNTQEFWQYLAGSDRWRELETIPAVGSTGKKKRVKAGADIVSTGYALYALKGGGTVEMWRYVVADLPPARQPQIQTSNEAQEPLAARLFPNPCRDQVTLVSQLPGHLRLELFDISGRTVLRTSAPAGDCRLTAHLDNLSAGVYLARITSGNSARTQRLIIER